MGDEPKPGGAGGWSPPWPLSDAALDAAFGRAAVDHHKVVERQNELHATFHGPLQAAIAVARALDDHRISIAALIVALRKAAKGLP